MLNQMMLFMVIPFNVSQKCVNLDLVNVIPTLKWGNQNKVAEFLKLYFLYCLLKLIINRLNDKILKKEGWYQRTGYRSYMRSFLYEESEQENILLTWFILKRIVWLLLFIRLFKVNISLGYIFILKYQGNCGQNLFKFSLLSLWLRVMRVGIESTVNVDNMSRHFFSSFCFLIPSLRW